jgi:excisionase family DNA binding protein
METNSPFIVLNSQDWNTHQAKLDRIENTFLKVLSQANNSEFFTPEETAKILKVSTKTLSNWREKELISFFQVGSNVRFTKEQIEEFIQKNSLKAKS